MALNNYGMGLTVSARDDASPALNNVADKLSKTSDASKKAKASFEDIGNEMKDIGSKMTLAGLGGAAGLGLAVNEATKFDAAVAEVASITTRAAFPISEIERIGKEMATTYGGDLTQQVKALYQAASSGASNAAEAAALMHQANTLATIGFTDSFKAVDALTNVLNAYGMKMTDAEQVSDAMFVTAKVGKTTIDELASQIGRVAPTAASVGVSMNDMMSVIAGASTQLGTGTAAVDGLKEALANIINPSKDAQDEAARLGIKFDGAALRAQGFEKFLKSITGSAKFNADTMGKLFGSMTAYNTMSALAANNGKAFDDALAAMSTKAGAAAAAFKDMSQVGQFMAGVLKANLQVAITDIGKVIAPVIGKLLVVFNELLKRFNAAPPFVKKLVAGLIAFVSISLIVVGALTSVIGGIIALTAVGEAALIAIAAAAGLMFQWLIGLGLLAAAFFMFKKAYDENLGGFADFVDGVYKKVKLLFDALVQVFSDGAFSGAVLTELKKAENAGIKDFAIQAFLWFNRIKNFFTGLVDGIQAGFQALAPMFRRMVAAIMDIGKALGFAKDGPVEAAEAFTSFGKMGERVGTIIADVAGVIIEVVTGIAQAVKAAIEVFQFMRKAGAPLGVALGSLFDSFVRIGEALGTVSQTGSTNTDMWKTLGATIGFIIGGIVNAIATFVNVVATIIAVVAPVITGVIQMFQGLWNFFAGFGTLLTGLLLGDWTRIKQGIAQIVFGLVQFIVGIFNALAGSVLGVVDKILQGMGKASNLAGDLKKEGQSILSSTQQGLGLQTAVGGQDRRPLPPVGQANPSAGLAGVNAATQAALAEKAPAANVNITVPLTLDGDKIGEANAKYQAGQNARSGAPNPAPA